MKSLLFVIALSTSSLAFACNAFITPVGEGSAKMYQTSLYADEIHQELTDKVKKKGFNLVDSEKSADVIFQNVVTGCAQNIKPGQVCPFPFAVLVIEALGKERKYMGRDQSSSLDAEIGKRSAALDAISKIEQCES